MEPHKIKILVDAHIFDHSFQGTATYIHGLYNALVENEQFEITLCAHDIDHLKTLFTDSRFKFVSLNSHSPYKRLLFEYPQIIKDGKFDYAHFQYIVPFFKGTKFVNTIHDVLFLKYKQYFPWKYRFTKGNLFRLSAKRSDIVLTVSDYSKNDVAHYFDIKENRIHVTPNAVSIAPASQVDIKSKYGIRNYILFVSRFEPRKNHIGLLKAYLANELYDNGYDLVFIGSKKEKIEWDAFQELQTLIPDEHRNNVHFLEKISTEDLNAFYKNAACFVFPSLAEGFGIPPIEAAVNDCKVLCSDNTAMQEFDFFKYRFDPNNQSELDEMLPEILQDGQYPFEEIKRAIIQKYNWHSIADHYNQILIKAL